MIGKKTMTWIFAGGAALLLLFYFLDLPAARAVYRPGTFFGAFFRTAAPLMPALVGLFYSCCLARSRREPPRLRVCGAALAVLCAAMGAALLFHYLGRRSVPLTVLTAAALLAAGLFCAGALRPDPAALRRAVAASLVMILAVLLTVELLKNLWGRPRFYAVAQGTVPFTRWPFPQGRPASDAFKSFPSGHTANGGAVLLILFLPSLFPAMRRRQALLAVLAGGWIFLTALSRMLEGMHYASDVTMGFLIAFAAFCAADRWIFRRARRNRLPASAPADRGSGGPPERGERR